MIGRPKMEGSQSWCALGQAFLPVLAVTKEDSNPLLHPKQEGGLGPECSKTGCPLFSALLSFQQLHGWNQLEKLVKMVYSMAFSVENWPICCSGWGWIVRKLGKWVTFNFLRKKSCYTPFLRAFQADFSHVIVEIIGRPKIEDSQS